MTLTSNFQKIAEVLIGNTGYGNVYIRNYARVSSGGPDIENNKTKVYVEARIYTEGGYWYSDSGTTYSISFSGSNSSGAISCNGRYEVGETVLGSLSGYVTHDSDGTKEIDAAVNFTAQPWEWDATAEANVELPTIPRYANFTSHSIGTITANSIQVNWGADADCDYIQYSLNGGSWVDTAENPYTISGLSSGTTYTIKTRIRRKDSQLWTESGTLTATTLAYAKFTSHSVGTITASSIQVNWGADSTCDAVYYSLNGGSWVGTIGNTYTISGLLSGTTYTIKTRIRRKDSKLWTESNPLTATTKDYVVKTKINNVWKDAVPYIKINNVWKKAIPYIKVSGNWKKGID